MTTHVTTQNPVRSDVAHHVTPRTSRRWTYAGIGAGLAGIGTIVTSGMVNAVFQRVRQLNLSLRFVVLSEASRARRRPLPRSLGFPDRPPARPFIAPSRPVDHCGVRFD